MKVVLENLTKVFPSRDKKKAGEDVVAVNSFNFEIPDGKLIGFDIELAKAVAEELDLDVEFKIINWNTKEAELESKTIDCIWNGMTITDERKAEMEVSIPYMNNKQVAVIRKADKDLYKNTDDMKNAIIGAEDGSAGMSCVVKEEEK